MKDNASQYLKLTTVIGDHTSVWVSLETASKLRKCCEELDMGSDDFIALLLELYNEKKKEVDG